MNAQLANSKLHIVPWLIGPIFLGMAVWLALSPRTVNIPPSGTRTVQKSEFAPYVRPMSGKEPPTIASGGFTHSCSDCHKLIEPPETERFPLMQHTDIAFNHGLNNRCFNCHDRKDRDKLVLHDGTLLPFDQVPRLCAQCHGTVYRDWQAGMHGKTVGSWDASSGLQKRLTCNDCHDPHSPAFPQFVPLPGPDTLRMGDQTRREEAPKRPSPLQRWLHLHADKEAKR